MKRPSWNLACPLLSLGLAGCEIFFPLNDPVGADRFAGCFVGPFSSPSGGSVTLILEGDSDDLTLAGCIAGTTPAGRRFNEDLTGSMNPDAPEKALLTVMLTNEAWTLEATRSPSGDVNATLIGLVNKGNAPFESADVLNRCASPAPTCETLALPQSFVPAGVQ